MPPTTMKPPFSLLILAALTLARTAFAEIQAGFAERDITPEIGQERPGSYRKAFHRSFHDACKVRVAVFADGKKKVALVGLDALMIPREVVLATRAEIERQCGIAGDAVMIGASHSHSSGPVGMVQPGRYDGASAEVRHLAYEESSLAVAGYLLRLRHEIVLGVKLAAEACVPAALGFGRGREDKVQFNRRLRMKNGETWTNPGSLNPDIVDYAGPIDPEVGVIGAWDLQGRLLGAVVNFACHPNISAPGISANFIHPLERTIQGALDSRAPVVFLQGASGDISQLDSLDPRERASDWMDVVGGSVGAEAVKVLLSMARGSEVPLDTRVKTWAIQRRVPSAENLTRARALVAAGFPRLPSAQTPWTFAKETLLLEHLIATEREVEVEVQAIQIGPLVCISNPAEYFVEYGLEMKRRSPFPFTFCVELANGCVGYVPTEDAFGPHGGGYETRLTSYSTLEITAGRQFAETGLALAHEMKTGPAPERPRIPQRGTPWLYGNVPPQRE